MSDMQNCTLGATELMAATFSGRAPIGHVTQGARARTKKRGGSGTLRPGWCATWQQQGLVTLSATMHTPNRPNMHAVLPAANKGVYMYGLVFTTRGKVKVLKARADP